MRKCQRRVINQSEHHHNRALQLCIFFFTQIYLVKAEHHK
jgi:hypothetical protein